MVFICPVVSVSALPLFIRYIYNSNLPYLRIDRNFCSVDEEITSIRLYIPYNRRSGLGKCVYNLIEVISNEPNK